METLCPNTQRSFPNIPVLASAPLTMHELHDVQRQARDESYCCYLPPEIPVLDEIRVEVAIEDEQRRGVHEQAGQLGHHHESVPRVNRERHHDELGEDERRVADLYDVDQLVLE